MLTFKSSEETHNTCFKFIGADSTTKTTTHLISNNTSLIAPTSSESCADTCSFYSGPSDSTIMAFGESCGSIAYDNTSESCGSIAYTGGGESCGSIASTSVSSGCSFSGGGSFSSYSC